MININKKTQQFLSLNDENWIYNWILSKSKKV